MTRAQATELLEQVTAERICEVIDLGGLLALEQELCQALADSGVPRTEVFVISARMIARAFTQFGEDHVKLASEDLANAEAASPSSMDGVS